MATGVLSIPRFDPYLPAKDHVRAAANAVFMIAVVAANFTLMRPSPVDILLLLALGLALVSGQVVTMNVIVFFGAVATWLLSLVASSMWEMNDPEASLLVVKIAYATSIAVCSALIAANWRREHLIRFVKVYVASAALGATLGIAGIVTGNEELTWDGRASGLFDDPNMYGAFLLTGLIGCMYMIRHGSRLLYGAIMGVLLLGLVLSFSRAAIVSFLLWGGLFFVYLNVRNLPRALAALYIVGVLILSALAVGAILDPALADKFADRTTLAKPYDLGHDGRYSRYVLSLDMILSNPTGLGVLVLHRMFDEPIHNILLSSYVNYGWAAGFAFTFLMASTVVVGIRKYRQTGEPLILVLLCGWCAVISCALLHEAERWRHLWMLFGIIAGLNVGRFARAQDAAASAPAPHTA